MKTIVVIVKPNGETSLQTQGFAGSSCQAASRQLEQALGLRGSEQLTAEYHAAPTTNSLHQEQGA